MNKKIVDVVAGDKTEWYTVLEVTESGNDIRLDVRFHDGGTGARYFDKGTELKVNE